MAWLGTACSLAPHIEVGSSTCRNGPMAHWQIEDIEVIARRTDGTVLIYKPTCNLGAHPCGCLLRLIFLGHRIVVSFVSFYVMTTLLSPRRAAFHHHHTRLCLLLAHHKFSCYFHKLALRFHLFVEAMFGWKKYSNKLSWGFFPHL